MASEIVGSFLNIVNVASVLWAGAVDYGRNQRISLTVPDLPRGKSSSLGLKLEEPHPRDGVHTF